MDIFEGTGPAADHLEGHQRPPHRITLTWVDIRPSPICREGSVLAANAALRPLASGDSNSIPTVYLTGPGQPHLVGRSPRSCRGPRPTVDRCQVTVRVTGPRVFPLIPSRSVTKTAKVWAPGEIP